MSKCAFLVVSLHKCARSCPDRCNCL